MRRRWLVFATVAGVLLAGCGSQDTDTGSDGAPDIVASVSPAPPAETSPPAESADPVSVGIDPDFLEFQADGETRESVKVASTVYLEPKIRTAEEISADPRFGPLLQACGASLQRDGVILGAVESTAQNGGFETQMGTTVYFYSPDGMATWNSNPLWDEALEGNARENSILAWKYAVGYSEPECATHETGSNVPYPQFGVGQQIPAGQDRTPWGPVDVVFIVPGFRSPAHPEGNPAYNDVLSHMSMCVANSGPYADTGGDQYLCAGDWAGGGSFNQPTGPGDSAIPGTSPRTLKTWFDFLGS